MRNDSIDRRELSFLRRKWKTRDGEQIEKEAGSQVPIIIKPTGWFEEGNVFLCNRFCFSVFKTKTRLEIDLNRSLNGLPVRSWDIHQNSVHVKNKDIHFLQIPITKSHINLSQKNIRKFLNVSSWTMPWTRFMGCFRISPLGQNEMLNRVQHDNNWIQYVRRKLSDFMCKNLMAKF